MKRIICVLLVTVLIVSMLLSCSIPLRNSGEEKQRIVVQLDQDYWLASVGKMLKEHFPDVEFDFVISRGGAQYLNDAALNDDLADIIIDAYGKAGSYKMLKKMNKRKVRMDESCSIQAPSSSCIKKNETTEVVSQKSNFEGSPHITTITAP
jgi:hypothetical protein